ncbi:MAG: hypothetical protein DWQ07_22085 [Chloroflexi bacterium]|nr:MAG: hypothetical protein DWQ07_22085 [Chloroflexota bacterium]MBL1196355.1 hypothetical protein [Chloroflexota bacterium]NOH13650.1 hypothetical protein [Chloroflexota bacterium]
MAITVIIHIANEDAVVGEIDDLPSPTDVSILVKNPRKRDGKDLHYLDGDVTTVLWPWNRITFIEVITSKAEEEVIGFVRE